MLENERLIVKTEICFSKMCKEFIYKFKTLPENTKLDKFIGKTMDFKGKEVYDKIEE